MAALVFVDTNVLLYAQDPRAPEKSGNAQSWLRWCWSEGRARISSQILNELYANVRRLAPGMNADAARRLVRRYRTWRPWPVDEATVDLAWDIEDRFGFNYWDCLMLAAAQQQGCRYLLTEDLQHLQQVDSVQVVDPFLLSPEDLQP